MISKKNCKDCFFGKAILVLRTSAEKFGAQSELNKTFLKKVFKLVKLSRQKEKTVSKTALGNFHGMSERNEDLQKVFRSKCTSQKSEISERLEPVADQKVPLHTYNSFLKNCTILSFSFQSKVFIFVDEASEQFLA